MPKNKTDIDWKKLLKIYRELHENAELGQKEFHTSEILKRELRSMGIPAEGMYGTGIEAVIYGKNPGKTLLYRADMDALPIEEKTGLSYASKNIGVMHACGHDIHMTCALGVAKMVSQMRERLHGNLKIMFQPCEEDIPGGAKQMIEAGILESPKVDAAFAMHVSPDIQTGKYQVQSGEVTASPSWFDIRIQGKGGHASQPEKSIHPIDAANELYLKLAKLREEAKRKEKGLVICPTMFHGGDVQNVIPDVCSIAGTVRTFSDNDTQWLEEAISGICTEIEKKKGVQCQYHFRTSMKSVFNDEKMAALMRKTIEKVQGEHSIQREEQRFMGGEDYAFIAEAVPSVFVFAGVNPGTGEMPPLHNACFRPDESMIRPTVEVFAEFVLEYLQGGKTEMKSELF